MTHDESSTIFNLENYNVYTSLFNSDVWLSANNHWLNSIGIKFFTFLGGYNELSIRLTNVLMFPFFALAVYYILKKTGLRPLLLWLGLIFFILNPLLIDFFSLARGYGMGTAFIFIGMAYYYRYFEKATSSHLLIANLAIILASLSLFSNVIFFFIFNAAIFIIIFLEKKSFIKFLLISIGSLFLLLLLTIIPLMALSKSDEFRWGATTLQESFISFSTDYLRHTKYFISYEMLTGIFITIILISLLGSIKLFKKTLTANDKFYLFTALSFVFLLVSMVLSKNIMGANYPDTRKTILYLPFVGFLPIFFLHYYGDKNIKKILGIGLIVLLTALFIKSVKPNITLEWWYDWDTKNIYQKIKDDAPSSAATVSTHWMFNPTISFYNQYIYDSSLQIIPYNKNIDSINQYDYYVSFKSDFGLLEQKYDIMYENGSGIVILKKRTDANPAPEIIPPIDKPTE